ncbi:DUF4262 domain-containing protein [Streptomyces albidochromogenes]|uniref:DUF4262 domain-containing protein n=1 Tax=Streptomyces albidochromogenes TaxID=329524 RepID=A0ABW6FGK0_9ACTN
MDDSPCFCLLCSPPSEGPAWDERDSQISASVTDFGWHVMGVGAGDEAPADWAYSIGLWHTLRSPEICGGRRAGPAGPGPAQGGGRSSIWHGSGARRLNWSRQQRSPGLVAWGFLVERVTRIELAL